MSTEFHRLRGAVHTGSGDQLNLFQIMEQAVTRRGAGAWSESIFEGLGARFYEPDGFGDVREAMEELKILVLKGNPGSGRRFAALALLRKSEYSPGLFYAPPVGTDDADRLDKLKPEPGDRFLIDLSTMSSETFNLVAHEVQPFFNRVLVARARSVLILPGDCEPEPDWQKYVRRLSRPDPGKAYRRHLKSIGIEFEADLDETGVRDHFRHAPMRDLDHLMQLVVDARTANPMRDYHYWTSAALEALRAGSDDVAALLKELKVGQQRALLLSASLFAGGSADSAWHAARALLDTLKYPKNPDHPLDQADLQEQLASFGAGIDKQRRLQFQKPLDAAIRTYLWDGYPALRAVLAKWIEGLIKADRVLAADDARLVVERFGEQHLRTGQVDPLKTLIAHLGGAEKELASELAFALLTKGLEDPEHGRAFRRLMWEWARDLPSAGLGEVLVQACVEVIAETYPEQALVRLHHLARKPKPIGDSACAALAGLFVQDRFSRLIRRLLSRMAEYPNARDPHIFVRVIDPFALTDSGNRARPLAAESGVHAHLVLAWRATLHKQPESWQPRLDQWLATVADVGRRDVLLTILAEAPDDLATRSLLLSAAVEWAAARGGAWKTVDELLNRINAAQGISFVAMERTD
ncbi:hypothetical protein KGQ20_42500 [Catenulispora sp. NF23]|uniref:Uncharacterized protein n=1 Tax=Catenulispora pinistramenti TaxID=2705254 RepID=A0ABS5L6W5_9ACTN|nr:hypothetical protein [Catenulispora pinistramenti]MBS2539436.1 hypothetical protein [Catenulispora pinistramenti]MBS2553975.1 hypothetical protein [Catenulispora pinistramenti]